MGWHGCMGPIPARKVRTRAPQSREKTLFNIVTLINTSSSPRAPTRQFCSLLISAQVLGRCFFMILHLSLDLWSLTQVYSCPLKPCMGPLGGPTIHFMHKVQKHGWRDHPFCGTKLLWGKKFSNYIQSGKTSFPSPVMKQAMYKCALVSFILSLQLSITCTEPHEDTFPYFYLHLNGKYNPVVNIF